MHALRLFRALSTAQHDQDLVFFIYAAVASSLVVLAGLMSGLTLGLLSLNSLDLELLKRSGTEQEKRYAERIAPVLKRPHFLLVTLVLCNAAATEALPIILDRLADPITAVLVSVVVVLIFGEIIPQAVCSRYGLVIGAYSAWFVRGLMWITCIVSYPISLILDKVLGEQHSALFRRAQLKALVDIHGHHEGLGGNLSTDEINIIRGALDMTNKTADQCMTPLDKVFMLSASDLVDEETLGRILDSGHSRIPVHTPGNRRAILGLILVKELIMVDKSQGLLVRDLHIRALPCLRSDTALYDMLKLFETGRCHMAVLEAPSEADICRRHSSVVEQQMENMLQVRVDEATSAKVEQGEFCPPEDASTGASIAADCSSENTPLLAASPVASGAKTPRLDGSAQDNRQPVGIVTIEDIIEELIQQEIVDETDRFVDNEHLQRVNAALLLQGLPDRLRMLLRSPAFMPRVGAPGNAGLPTASPQPNLTKTPVRWGDTDTFGHRPSRYTSPARTAHSDPSPARARVRSAAQQMEEHERLMAAMDLLQPLLAADHQLNGSLMPPQGNGRDRSVTRQHQRRLPPRSSSHVASPRQPIQRTHSSPAPNDAGPAGQHMPAGATEGQVGDGATSQADRPLRAGDSSQPNQSTLPHRSTQGSGESSSSSKGAGDAHSQRARQRQLSPDRDLHRKTGWQELPAEQDGAGQPRDNDHACDGAT